jgi:tripartite-type tricarboxylate transporter receptor subunit TctC
LSRELKAALATAEVKGYFSEAGIEIVGSTPAEMDTFFRDERDHWARVVKDTGAKID